MSEQGRARLRGTRGTEHVLRGAEVPSFEARRKGNCHVWERKALTGTRPGADPEMASSRPAPGS